MSRPKIDSNIVALNFAEELPTIGILPGVAEANAVWFPLEPNEFSDFGGEVTTMQRKPISASRQNRKGTVVDIEASGGFTQDLTQSNLTRLMQGFFFADAREKTSNAAINGNVANTVVLSNIAAGTALTVNAGGGAKFVVGQLVRVSGMKVAANNQLVTVVSIAAEVLTTSGTFFVETVDANSSIEVVGCEIGSGIAAITVVGPVVNLTRSTGTFLTLGLNVGEWIFIGGDVLLNQFALNVPGYARIRSISALALQIEECSWTPAADVGAAKVMRVFFGDFLRNEKTPSLIKQRSYNLERVLGQDANGFQSEYLIGSVPNELTLNLASNDKLTCELSFASLNNVLRNGLQGLKAGTRTATLPVEDAFNTASNIFQLRLFVLDPAAITPVSLFAFVRDVKLTINNNVKGLKAIGRTASFDVTVGDFEVSGELEVYFSTVAAVAAVKNNADVGFNAIAANRNAGIVFDVPLLQLGGGRVTVEKDEAIILPLEKMAVECSSGYTMSVTLFHFLPNSAMPVVQ